MKIGIDASVIESPKRTGVGNYLLYLLKYIGRLFPENEYILYFNNTIPDYDFLEQKCFIKKILKKPSFLFWPKGPLWNTYCIPKELAFHKVDVFFSSVYTLPFFWSNIKSVVTIYDISYEIHPEWFNPHWAKLIRNRSQRAAKKSSAIITVSEYSKREIVRHYNIPEEKVHSIYLGVEEFFHPSSDSGKINCLKEKYKIKKEYLLHLGALYPRRNVPLLLEVFQLIANKLKDYQLVIVGEDPFGIIKKRVEEINQILGSDKVIYIEHIPDEDIVYLYNGASLFLYLSTYEGFGLTPLEAMACGVPVITTRYASIPEVVGDAGFYVDPYNVEEIASAIMKVLSDESLKHKMIEKGLERAKLFSWEKTAKETMGVFRKVANEMRG